MGHSQGAMMPRYYLKNLGGGSKVRSLTGLAPSNYGTDVTARSRCSRSSRRFKVISSLLPVGSAVLDLSCKACKQQREGSRFLIVYDPVALGLVPNALGPFHREASQL